MGLQSMPLGDGPPPGATHLIGVDEAGRGPVIGPLVVAALAVPVQGGEDRLREMRVRDSKKLQVARRERLYHELSAHVPTTFLVVPRHGPRGRFLPVKEPADLDEAQRHKRELLDAPITTPASG